MDRIVILDFGSQTTHLIGRRIREVGVYAAIVNGVTPSSEWFDRTVRGIILSGSPASVHDADAPQPDPAVYGLGVPILGICYGLQVTTHLHGGLVNRSVTREYGPATVQVAQAHPLLASMPVQFTSWMSHGDSLQRPADGAVVHAQTTSGVSAVVGIERLNFVGLQFHPEVTHSENGQQILANFALRICGATPSWTMAEYLTSLQRELPIQVGKTPVLLLISGGVDSTVVGALLLRVLDPQLVHLMYVDTGLMRAGESEQVAGTLRSLGAKHLHLIDARAEFLDALAGEADPERKRHIIGDLFITVQEREIARHLSGDYFLAQGTLYTDMIESGRGVGSHAVNIKSHHNVASPLVDAKRRAGRIIEPLSSLYKDEVRALGVLLGLGHAIVGRHPFPGPGLAVRILGEVTAERCEILRHADQIFIEELRRRELYDKIWQAFAVLLPVRSVGVAGDSRVYGNVVALRAVVSKDGMTADMYDFNPRDIREIAARITNEVPAVGRVVYDLSSKPPATIEWE